MSVVVSILQWTLAIASILGTVALLAWMAVMFLKKDR
jgi:hypothetical protein